MNKNVINNILAPSYKVQSDNISEYNGTIVGRQLMAEDLRFGIYVHWPFCLSKCPYCDFNSHVRLNGYDEARFVAAYLKELTAMYELTKDLKPKTLYFGGGTPSLMSPSSVEAIVDKVAALWSIDTDIEITLEANPTSADADNFKGYCAAGVNRLSVGVQSFDDDALRYLGRQHSAKEARDIVALTQSIFSRSTFDLIYGLPDQSLEQWSMMLDQACSMAHGHLSLYQLTVEPGTAFFDLEAKGRLTMPSNETLRAFADVTGEVTSRSGYDCYEVSNYACTGQESQHNLTYWRYGQYLGVGPGAHGRIMLPEQKVGHQLLYRRYGTSLLKSPEAWLEAVEAKGDGYEQIVPLNAEEEGDEMLLMGLRLREGISIKRFEMLRGKPLKDGAIKTLCEMGFIDITESGKLRVTPLGFPVLDAVVADLAA